jgi:hypothetical protein
MLCPREDRLLLPQLSEKHKGPIIEYEALGDRRNWKLRPRTAILLPYKRAPRQSFGLDVIERGAAFALRQWFCAGCHLVAIVPRRNSEGQSFRDGDLRAATAGLLSAAVPGFRFVHSDPPVDPGQTRIVMGCNVIELQPMALKFFISTWSLAPSRMGPPGVLDEELIPESLKATGEFETLAENELGQPVAVTYRRGPGRITVIPRGMLAGEHAWLNDMIPRVLVLRFPYDYRVDAALKELGTSPAELNSTSPPQKPRSRFADDLRKTWLLINGRAHKVPWRGRLFLQLVFDATWKRRQSPHVPFEVRWPTVLTDPKTRENVVHGLRERLDQLGFDVVTRGTPTVPPGLSAAALAGLSGIDHGWERWDELAEGSGDLEELHQVQPRS